MKLIGVSKEEVKTYTKTVVLELSENELCHILGLVGKSLGAWTPRESREVYEKLITIANKAGIKD